MLRRLVRGTADPSTILPWLAPFALVGAALQFFQVLHSQRVVPDLSRAIPDKPWTARKASPGVYVVVAIRDEAPALRRALPTLLAQDHPSMQLIVVDDRSKDATRQTGETLVAELAPGRHEGA